MAAAAGFGGGGARRFCRPEAVDPTEPTEITDALDEYAGRGGESSDRTVMLCSDDGLANAVAAGGVPMSLPTLSKKRHKICMHVFAVYYNRGKYMHAA